MTTQHLTRNGMLRLICTVKVQRLIIFGCTFRAEFVLLEQSLFQYLHLNNGNVLQMDNYHFPTHLKVILLLIAETFNVELLSVLQHMIDIRIIPSSHSWSGRDIMQCRTARMPTSISSQCLKKVK